MSERFCVEQNGDFFRRTTLSNAVWPSRQAGKYWTVVCETTVFSNYTYKTCVIKGCKHFFFFFNGHYDFYMRPYASN